MVIALRDLVKTTAKTNAQKNNQKTNADNLLVTSGLGALTGYYLCPLLNNVVIIFHNLREHIPYFTLSYSYIYDSIVT